MSGARLLMDPRLLGLQHRRIFLGSRNLGHAAASGRTLDAGVLGLGRRRVPVSRRILGAARGFLRRAQFRRRRTWGGALGGALGAGPRTAPPPTTQQPTTESAQK